MLTSGTLGKVIHITPKNLTSTFLLLFILFFQFPLVNAYKAEGQNYTAYITIGEAGADFNNNNYQGKMSSSGFVGKWNDDNEEYDVFVGGLYSLYEVDIPQIQITSPSDGYSTSSSSITMTWTLSHEGAGVKNYWVKVNTGSWQNVGKNTSTSVSLSCGSNTLYVKATDNFDRNTSAVSISVKRNCPSGQQQQGGVPSGGGAILPRKKGLGESCTHDAQCESGLCYMLKCAECTNDGMCAESEYCKEGLCIPVECPCGEIKNHKCIAYECCSNADCKEGYACNIETHKCEKIVLPKLLIIVPDEILEDKEFELAVRVEKGGYINNVEVKVNEKEYKTDNRGRVKLKLKAGKYKITATKESFTSDTMTITVKKRYKIILPDKIEAGKEVKIIVVDEEGNPAANVVIKVTLPDGSTVTLKTNEKGEAYLLAEKPGRLKVSIGAETIEQVTEEVAVEIPEEKIPIVEKPQQISLLLIVIFAIIIIAALFGGKFVEILRKTKLKQKKEKETKPTAKWKK